MTDIEQRAHDLAVEAASKIFDLDLQAHLAQASSAAKDVKMTFVQANIGVLCDYYIKCYNSFKDKLEAEL